MLPQAICLPQTSMEAPAMDRFIRRQNVQHYRHLLTITTDEKERQRILRLLEEEQQKQRDADDKITD